VIHRIESSDPFPLEVATTFELARNVAAGVRAAIADGQFPLVLAGNCFTAVGTIAGLANSEAAVAWFDCHGDFHTPESTTSGFLDGMALATLTGRCWTRLAAAVPGFQTVLCRNLLHLAGRDFDAGEREAMVAADIRVCDAEMLRGSGPAALDAPAWSGSSRGLYAHLDLDALDPGDAPANGYQKPGGLSVALVEELLRRISRRVPLQAAALTAYDPACDPRQQMGSVASRLVRCLVEFAAESR
jgi:arginase